MILNRTSLKSEFKDGERPSGTDFSSLLDSYIHKEEDGMSIAGEDLVLSKGLTVGDSSREVAGTIRFSSGVFQFHNGTEWQDLGTGSGGGFTPVDSSGAMAYNAGNVGINTGTTSPVFRFEANLGETTATSGNSEQVRIGNMAFYRGEGSSSGNNAYLGHRVIATNPARYLNDFALRQEVLGNTILNCPGASNRYIRLTNGNNAVPGLQVSDNRVFINSSGLPSGTAPLDPVTGGTDNPDIRLYVAGATAKNTAGGGWLVFSDSRTKNKIRPFKEGLEKLKALNPISFRYNGKAGTLKGDKGVSLIAQELEKVFPDMIHKGKGKLDDQSEETDIYMTDTSALIFVAINAIKELSFKIETIERQLDAKLKV